jgi:hypothetical protein
MLGARPASSSQVRRADRHRCDRHRRRDARQRSRLVCTEDVITASALRTWCELGSAVLRAAPGDCQIEIVNRDDLRGARAGSTADAPHARRRCRLRYLTFDHSMPGSSGVKPVLTVGESGPKVVSDDGGSDPSTTRDSVTVSLCRPYARRACGCTRRHPYERAGRSDSRQESASLSRYDSK